MINLAIAMLSITLPNWKSEVVCYGDAGHCQPRVVNLGDFKIVPDNYEPMTEYEANVETMSAGGN